MHVAQLTGFEGFSNTIPFAYALSHPNNGYPMKKYIKLNSIMPFWAMQKCCETYTHFLKKNNGNGGDHQKWVAHARPKAA